MLVYKKGNIIDAYLNGNVDVIAHQCNCHCVMGAGLAKQLRLRIPGVYKADLSTKKGDRSKLGNYTRYNNVYNLYGQYNYGKGLHTDYDALDVALRGMVTDIELRVTQPITVGLPRLGCGLAGGDWDVVSELIVENFRDRELINKVVIYDLDDR